MAFYPINYGIIFFNSKKNDIIYFNTNKKLAYVLIMLTKRQFIFLYQKRHSPKINMTLYLNPKNTMALLVYLSTNSYYIFRVPVITQCLTHRYLQRRSQNTRFYVKQSQIWLHYWNVDMLCQSLVKWIFMLQRSCILC